MLFCQEVGMPNEEIEASDMEGCQMLSRSLKTRFRHHHALAA